MNTDGYIDGKKLVISASTKWALDAVNLGINDQAHRQKHWNWAIPILAGNYEHFSFANQSYPQDAKSAPDLPTSLDVVIMEGFISRVQALFRGDLLKDLGFWDEDDDLCGHMLSSLVPGAQWIYDLSESGDVFWRLQGRHWYLTADGSGLKSLYVAVHKAFLDAALPKAIVTCDETGEIEEARFHNIYRLELEKPSPYWQYLALGGIFKTYHGILDCNLQYCDFGKDEDAKYILADQKNMRNDLMIEMVKTMREKYYQEKDAS